MEKREFILDGLNCANCANKIEKMANNINGVNSANLDFMNKKLKVEIDINGNSELVVKEIKGIVDKIEPDVKVLEANYEHSHDHIHGHGELSMKNIVRLAIGAILFIFGIISKENTILELSLFVASYFIVGTDILIRAGKNIVRGQVFDENFLMALATIGAFLVGQYPEAVAVMLFYQIGELLQDLAVNRSRKSIKSLMDIRPDYANLKTDGDIRRVNPVDVHIGDIIIVKPGEKVPLDGIVVSGSSMVDTSNITGETVPRTAKVGDEVLSGFVNNSGLLTMEVSKEYGESTVSKILDLVENASSKKAPTENFITKFARYYTPIVVISAIVIAFIPPLFIGSNLKDWVYRALIFLVISCPCALVISVPLGFFGGIGGASKSGILVKGGNYLEGLNEVDTIVFDKTGTLTKGVFRVTDIESMAGDKEDVLKVAAYAESFSNHPIGKSIVDAYGKEIDREEVENYKEVSGKGVKAKIFGDDVLVGNYRLFQDENIDITKKDTIGTIVYVAKNGDYVGNITISDEIKDDSREAIKELKNLGIKNTIMLTGDNKQIAHKVGKTLEVDEVYGELLPQDKVKIIEKIMKDKKEGKVAFVGDGVNDAPVLARADIGIAMGGLGSDAAIEASDIVIMTDEPTKLITGIKIAKRTNRIVTQNIIFALGVKLIVLILGAFGVATMWQAVFADVGVSVIAVLNSTRALKVKEK